MEKTVHLKITTTFVTYKDYEVEGDLTDKEILEQANSDGDFLEDVLDTLDIDTVVEFDEEEHKYSSPFDEEEGKRNGWQIAIDLTGVDENGTPEENLEMIGSPLFETEEEADTWYRSLEITENDLARINKGLDIIMIHWVNGEIADTYVY